MADESFINLPAKAKDHRGERHGRLVMVGPVGQGRNGDIIWLAKCDCGGEMRDRYYNIRHSKGCGCHRAERMATLQLQHGHARERELDGTPIPRERTYCTWLSMKARCYDRNHDHYDLYGARGIRVCDRWKNDFSAFLADMGIRPPGRTLDRIDGRKDYSPGNCRWATPLMQRHNQERWIRRHRREASPAA